jgi:N-acetylmuramoyl-L-alanine amidase
MSEGEPTLPNNGLLNRRRLPRTGLRIMTLVCLALAAWPAPNPRAFALLPGRASAKRERAAKAYTNALKLRAALEARAPQARSYKDYMKVARAFDLVYRTDPGYAKTPSAIAVEASVYQEMGHVLRNNRYYESAVATYQFLADQYGGAAVARDALLTVGDIYRVDLGDTEGAAKAYSDYLTRFPYAANAPEARQRLEQMNHREAAQAAESAQAAVSPAAVESAAPPEGPALASGRLLAVSDVRYWEGPNYVRIVISVEDEAKFEAARLQHPDRIVFDLPGTHLSQALKGKSFPIGNGFVREVRVAQFTPEVSRVVLDVAKIDDYSVFTLPNPFRLIIDVRGPAQPLLARSAARMPGGVPVSGTRASFAPPPESAQPVAEAPETSYNTASVRATPSGTPAGTTRRMTSEPVESSAASEPADTTDTDETPAVTSANRVNYPADKPANSPANRAGSALEGRVQPSAQTSSGSSTLTRALGLKIARIVIDPGHGGHDTGTIGPDGLEEKNVVLDVGLRLRKLIQQRMGSQVVMTRSDDTFIPLEERTAIANQRSADLFISIHANASRDPSARGIEVYYLNFTSDPNSLEVAARENATSQESVHQLQSLIKKIALTEKIQESDEFARQVDQSLDAATARTGNEQPDRGLKKAPFVVLIGANMPSILAEISFLTNPRDEHLLSEANYRQQIAEGLYRGIARYVANLGSVKIAERNAGSLPPGSASRPHVMAPPAAPAVAGGAPDE